MGLENEVQKDPLKEIDHKEKIMDRILGNSKYLLDINEKKSILEYHKLIGKSCFDKREHFERSLFLIKRIVQNKKGHIAENVCAEMIQDLLLQLNHLDLILKQDDLLGLFNEPKLMETEDIISFICEGSEKNPILCVKMAEILKQDLIQVPYDKQKCVELLMKKYVSFGYPKEIIPVYHDLCGSNDRLIPKIIDNCLHKQKYQEIIDLFAEIGVNNKFDYEALLISYHKTGNIAMEKKTLFDYFEKFPNIEILEKMLLILDEEEIESYRPKIMNSAMKSREILKETCMRIGNTDDLYFLLRKGNLNLSERIRILSRHTIELYKKDAECTLLMMKKDLISILHSYRFSESQLQDLVFSMTKLKKGREFLNDILKKIEKEENKKAIKTIIKSVMEENQYVYSENYEAESWG